MKLDLLLHLVMASVERVILAINIIKNVLRDQYIFNKLD